MKGTENSRFVRLDVRLLVEVDDPGVLRSTALERIAGDAALPDGERERIGAVVTKDTAEALAYLVDPFDLVAGLPGIELTQTSWSAEHVAHDPAARHADPYGEDGALADEDDDAAYEEDDDAAYDDEDDDRDVEPVRIG